MVKEPQGMRDTGHDILDLVPGPVKGEAARLLNRLRNEHWEQAEQFDKNFKKAGIMNTKMLEIATLAGVVMILLLMVYQNTNKQIRCMSYGIEHDIFVEFDRYSDECISNPALDYDGNEFTPPPAEPADPGQVLPVPPNPTEEMGK